MIHLPGYDSVDFIRCIVNNLYSELSRWGSDNNSAEHPIFDLYFVYLIGSCSNVLDLIAFHFIFLSIGVTSIFLVSRRICYVLLTYENAAFAPEPRVNERELQNVRLGFYPDKKDDQRKSYMILYSHRTNY